MLKWVKDMYNNPEIFITENGVADDGSHLDDTDRIEFYEVISQGDNSSNIFSLSTRTRFKIRFVNLAAHSVDIVNFYILAQN